MTTQATILVVNDAPAARYLMTRILRAAGWAVAEATGGFEALTLAGRIQPDVVVLDIRLPDIDGYEVAKKLKDDAHTAGACIIQTSATFMSPEGKVRGVESGADAYLTQPFEAIELVAMVKSLLRLKKSEAEARHQSALLLEADRRKDEFLAMLGHELRNPLSAIVMAASLLEQKKHPAEQEKRLNATILRQAQNLTRLVDDLLDVSRITQGKIHLAMATVDLRVTAQSVVRAQKGEIDKRAHAVHLEVGEVPLWVKGDATRLEQIVGNLLANAVKYTADGGRIDVTLSQRPAPGGMRVVCAIRDNGVGLAKEEIASIWGLFVQVESSLARTAGGLGVGLTMVRRLAEMHGGTVSVTSDGRGTGSEFSFELPCVAGPSVAPAADAPKGESARYRILLVDDNEDARALHRQALQQCGHEVECAPDGQVGIALALGSPFDVAIIDIGLPSISGYDVARSLRTQLGSNRPYLVALTGYGRAEDRQRALDAGFDAHVVKPIEAAAVENLFGRLGDRSSSAPTCH